MPALQPFASDPARSRGRLHAADHGERGPRDAFQRDRDRIIHSVPFRRLRHKTQVFVAPDGDHFRVRLTHSLEVAQIGRTLARALGLNEDLTEALCLAHDIGHPPFGHSGEDALRAAMVGAGGFDHNAHTLRLLTRLEAPYPRHLGLNSAGRRWRGSPSITGRSRHPIGRWPRRMPNCPLDWPPGPAWRRRIAAISDDIAYDNHDIDDGMRAGLFGLDELLAVPFVARHWDAVRVAIRTCRPSGSPRTDPRPDRPHGQRCAGGNPPTRCRRRESSIRRRCGPRAGHWQASRRGWQQKSAS
jgi:dGTPase